MLLVSALSACHSSKSAGEDGRAARTASRAEAAESGAADAGGQDAPYPYAAIITCSTSGMQVDVIACFSGSSDTNLELKNGDKYGLYQPMDIESLGKKTSEGMRIELARKFELTMQNASDSLILGVKIVNNIPSSDFGKVLYEKKVAEFGVIKVDN
jgi:hypothetical protein